jgi:hypothetical protein
MRGFITFMFRVVMLTSCVGGNFNTSDACLRNRDGTSSWTKLVVSYKCCCRAVQYSGEKGNAIFVSLQEGHVRRAV